jgi:hypothetical protein
MSLWTIANTESELWIDAADENSLTLINGKVSKINDKSGNNRHALQNAAAERPGYLSDALNGLGVLQSDGSLQGTGAGLVVPHVHWGDSVTLFSLVQTFATSNASINAGVFDCATKIQFGAAKGLRHDLLVNSYRMGVATQASADFLVADRSRRTSWLLFASRYDATTGRSLFVDSEVVASDDLTGPIDYGDASDTQLMRLTDRSRGLWGHLAELVVFGRALDEDIRKKVEGYLIHKWGLQENLPTGHPYKDAPPHTGSSRRRRMMMQRGRL